MSAQVEQAFYRAWKESSTSDKVLLALFEAGIVESGMRNLNYGDRDSLGALQQRAPWGPASERLDPYSSAKKFIAKAQKVDKSGFTAGQLAQAVQVSAFPLKYDAVAVEAKAMIARQGGSTGGSSTPSATPVGFTSSISKLTSPITWRIFALNLIGFILIIVGVFLLFGEEVVGSQLGEIAKTAIKVAK